MDFSYEVVCLWQRPAEELLSGALGTTPLAMLGGLPDGLPTLDALSLVAQRLIERLERDASPEKVRKLLTAAFLLTGLRVRRELAQQVFRGVRAMRDSDTYMMILEEGEEIRAKNDILNLGRKRFGVPDMTTTTRLESIADLAQLDRIFDRLLDVTNWQELLDTP